MEFNDSNTVADSSRHSSSPITTNMILNLILTATASCQSVTTCLWPGTTFWEPHYATDYVLQRSCDWKLQTPERASNLISKARRNKTWMIDGVQRGAERPFTSWRCKYCSVFWSRSCSRTTVTMTACQIWVYECNPFTIPMSFISTPKNILLIGIMFLTLGETKNTWVI